MLWLIIAVECVFALIFLTLVWRFRRRHNFGFHRILRRLETTPGQEQVIRTALSEFRRAVRQARDETQAARPELAELVRQDTFDETQLKSWLASRERSFGSLRPAAIESIRAVHGVLDAEQRGKLADWLKSGRSYFFPYRHRSCRAHS